MPKRRCVFTKSSEAEYPFFKGRSTSGKSAVLHLQITFSIQHGGHLIYSDISRKENMQLLQKLKVAVKM
jgi:hypothetical protein